MITFGDVVRERDKTGQDPATLAFFEECAIIYAQNLVNSKIEDAKAIVQDNFSQSTTIAMINELKIRNNNEES